MVLLDILFGPYRLIKKLVRLIASFFSSPPATKLIDALENYEKTLEEIKKTGITSLRESLPPLAIKIMKAIISGADINTVDPETGKSALHLFLQGKDNVSVKLLLAQNPLANVNLKDKLGRVPWVYTTDEEIRSLLKERGADVENFLKPRVPKPYSDTTDDKIELELQLTKLLSDFEKYNSRGNFKQPFYLWSGVQSIMQRVGDLKVVETKTLQLLLHTMVIQGYDDIVGDLLAKGADVKVKDDQEKTLLHAAAASKNLQVVKVLIENNAEINAIDKLGKTPLHYAIEKSNYDMVVLLLNEKADINLKDNEGKSPLDYVHDEGFDKKGKDVLDNHSRMQIRALIDPSSLSPTMSKEQIGQNSPTGTPSKVEAISVSLGPDTLNFTPKDAAFRVISGPDKTRALTDYISWLDRGTKQFSSSPEVFQRLDMEQRQKLEEGIGALLGDIDAGNVNITEPNTGMTPLHLMVLYGSEDMVKKLLDAGARIDAIDTKGKTSLHYAVEQSKAEDVQAIVESIKKSAIDRRETINSTLDLKDNEGKTPLHYASSKGDYYAIRELIKAGANIGVKDGEAEDISEVALDKNVANFIQALMPSSIMPSDRIEEDADREGGVYQAISSSSLSTRGNIDQQPHHPISVNPREDSDGYTTGEGDSDEGRP